VTTAVLLQPTRLLKTDTAGCIFCFCYLFFLFLTIPVEPIISTGPTFAKLSLSGLVKQNYTAVDERSEINVSIPQGTFPRQAIFAGFIH